MLRWIKNEVQHVLSDHISVLPLIKVVSLSDIIFFVKQIRQNYNNYLQPCTTTSPAADISVFVVIVIIIIILHGHVLIFL